MPREVLHWDVLSRSAELCDGKSKNRVVLSAGQEFNKLPIVGSILEKYEAFASLGAILHDVPYYYKRGKHQFHSVGDNLHGYNGANTREHFISLVELLVAKKKNQDIELKNKLWAVLLGMLSHHATDIVFHPVVYYYTGNYYDKDPIEMRAARFAHRLFETYLDSWAVFNQVRSSRRKISELIDELGEDIYEVLRFVSEGLPYQIGDTDLYGCWLSGLNTMSGYQSMFVSPIYGGIVSLLAKLGISFAKNFDPLFFIW